MTKDVKDYVQKCHSCAIHKTQPQKPAELVIAEIPSEVFGKVSMDLVGPLNITHSGNKYILTFIDYLTRYAETIPIPNIKTDTIAKAFVETIILRHGVPQVLLTDRGSQFISAMFKEVCKLLGIKKIFTSPYHPECNAVIERLHKSLKQMISHFVSESDPNWDKWLPYATMAYRNAVHDGTKETPFYLLFGRDMRLPEYAPRNSSLVKYNLDANFASELTIRLEKARRAAFNSLNERARKQSERYNQKAKTRQFEVGQLVYMKAETKPNSKLATSFQPKWSGPYRIIQVMSPVNYKIRNLSTMKESNIHINRLKLCHTSSNDAGIQDPIHEQVIITPPLESQDPVSDIYYPSLGLKPPPSQALPIPIRIPQTPPIHNAPPVPNIQVNTPPAGAANQQPRHIYVNPLFEWYDSDDDEEIIFNAEQSVNQEPEDEVVVNEPVNNAAAQHPYHTRSKGRAEDNPWVLRKRI